MKSFKKILLGLALATCALMNASATVYTDFQFVQAQPDETSNKQAFVFADGGAPAVAGDSFVYDFLFNTLDAASSFDLDILPDVAGSIQFTGFSFTGADGSVIPYFNSNLSDSEITGFGYLGSGVYLMEITGNFLSDAATVTGASVTDLSDPVMLPEPMSLALMGVGVAGLIGTRRRRGAVKAA